ncbi:MAG TPA: nuclear transport factor 2 family protein, partial [Chryseolinea sp.]
MKFYFVFAFVFLFASANAQNFSPALQSMVDAENAFARHSKEKNTRDAFLLYLTDSTVLFDKSGPAWGKKSWQERTPNTSLLFWQPLLVGISKDGDLGFSTGPWEWAPSREAKPEAYGYFASVWRKFSDGWKL